MISISSTIHAEVVRRTFPVSFLHQVALCQPSVVPETTWPCISNSCDMQALPLLSSVILLLLIFVFLFGVAGTQLFQAAAHQVCVNNVDGSYPDPQPTENSDEWGCGHRHCPTNYTCTVSHNKLPALRLLVSIDLRKQPHTICIWQDAIIPCNQLCLSAFLC